MISKVKFQILDCTKVLGAVGWEGGDGGEDLVDNHLLLEGEKEEEGRGKPESEKFLFIDLNKGELRIV